MPLRRHPGLHLLHNHTSKLYTVLPIALSSKFWDLEILERHNRRTGDLGATLHSFTHKNYLQLAKGNVNCNFAGSEPLP